MTYLHITYFDRNWCSNEQKLPYEISRCYLFSQVREQVTGTQVEAPSQTGLQCLIY